MALRIFSRLIGIIPFSRKSEQMKKEISYSFLNKFKKKMIFTISRNLTIFGRINDSVPHLQEAIDLGYLPARADLALLYFTANHPYQMCEHAFELLKRGHEYGCPDCTGMLAFYYVTGCRGVTNRYDDSYSLACQSSAAGSWFGKMALVHFLNRLLGVQDPDEDTFYVLWTDPFIQNFACQSIHVPAPAQSANVSFKGFSELPIDIWAIILQKTRSLQNCENLYSALPIQSRAELKNLYEAHIDRLLIEDWFNPHPDILSDYDIFRIARILIKEIQQEHLRNPDMPKVLSNLPVLKL
jgi:hypothetical protein